MTNSDQVMCFCTDKMYWMLPGFELVPSGSIMKQALKLHKTVKLQTYKTTYCKILMRSIIVKMTHRD